jgi:arylsulfatase A-like enzyme
LNLKPQEQESALAVDPNLPIKVFRQKVRSHINGLRMNLLFITSDHQRADSIGMNQSGRPVTPHLNALAADGVHFSRVYTACPLCVPARAAMATGMRPARNGVEWNDWQGSHAKECITIHERLAAAGYALGHTGMDHVRLGPRLRERTDFAVWLDEVDHEQYLKAHGCDMGALEASGPFRKKVQETIDGEVRSNDYSTAHMAEWPFAREDFRDEFFTRGAESAITELARGEKPFAMFVNYWAPHPPLYVPPDLINLFPPEEIELPANVGFVAVGEPANRRLGIAAQLSEGVNEEGWRRAWSAHLALTHLVDQQVGRLLQVLESNGCGDDTLVVFTSDHGEHLGQHAMYQKMELYEQASLVPLIVRGPGVTAGQQVDVPVSHLDLVPTLMDMIGADAPGGLDGRSLAPALRNETELDIVPVFTQFTGNNGPSVARYAVILGDFKLILDASDRSELYDLTSDPLEMNNRSGDPKLADMEAGLTAQIRQWLDGNEQGKSGPSAP